MLEMNWDELVAIIEEDEAVDLQEIELEKKRTELLAIGDLAL